MSAVLDFLQGIAAGVSAALDFLMGLIEDVAYVVKITAEFVTQIPSYISWLPASVVAIIVSIFVVVVIYKILGREG